MKWLFYLAVLLYVLYKSVYCEVQDGLSIEKDSNIQNWAQGTRHEIICRGTHRNQQIEWENPSQSKIDFRDAQESQRVYVQDRTKKNSVSTLVLVITQLWTQDTGVWKCLSGDIVENVVICVVDEARFIDSPTEITVDRGRAITLTCSAFGDPEPFINWYKNDEAITDDDSDSEAKYKIMTKYNTDGRDGLLTILNADVDDVAVYTCEAVQTHEDTELCYHNDTLNINLYVNYEPTMQSESSIEHPINKIYAESGEVVHIKCKADGYPEPEYKWIQKHAYYSDLAFNSSLVTMKDHVSYLNVIADDGIFKKEIACIARNPFGKATKIFKLLPITIPDVTIKVRKEESNNTSILFSLAWDHPIETIINDIVVTYIETSILPEGKIRKESDWRGSRKKYIDWEEESDEKCFVTIDELEPETKYWFKFSLRNNYGMSPWTKPIEAMTTELNEEEAPDEIIVEKEISERTSEYPSNNFFYAIVFLGGMVGTIFVCSLVIKIM